jgi:hypothetical protein
LAASPLENCLNYDLCDYLIYMILLAVSGFAAGFGFKIPPLFLIYMSRGSGVHCVLAALRRWFGQDV